MKPALLDKTVAVTNRRLAAMGGGDAVDLRAPHEPAALSAAIQRALGDGAGIVLVMGGSAIIDRRDVIPAAIERSGGKVAAVRHAGRSRQPDPAGRDRAASRSSACPAARARPSSTASTGCCSA